MKIALLPYGYRYSGRLANVRLEDLQWPLGEPKSSGTIGDLGPNDHLIIYPRSKHLFDPRLGVKCHVSLLIAEPYSIQRRKYLWAIALKKRFYRIITHRPSMVRWAGNVMHMPFGGSWVDPHAAQSCDKTRNMSLIASTKKVLTGHALRHEIAEWCGREGQDVELLGRAYRPVDRKEEGLAPYRFSIVIENSREEGYFTEKLIDSLLCDTVPIYWGAPDIERYFDLDGMIVCRSAEDIKRAVAEATPDLYADKRPAIERNHKAALAYIDFEKNAAEKLLQATSLSSQAGVQ